MSYSKDTFNDPTVHVICKVLLYSVTSKANRSLHFYLHKVFAHHNMPDQSFTDLGEHDHL